MHPGPPPHYSVIVAHNSQRAIGCRGAIPWHSPQDLEWFRMHTAGKLCVVGPATARQLPSLPGRELWVLGQGSPRREVPAPLQWASSSGELHSQIASRVAAGACPEVMVCGGSAVYQELLPLASRMYRTWVGFECPLADRFFPPEGEGWSRVYRKGARESGFSLEFEIWNRAAQPTSW